MNIHEVRSEGETGRTAKSAWLRADGDWLTASQVNALGGRSKPPVERAADEWRDTGRIFGVEFNGERLFPSFQFDAASHEPLPVVADVLSFLGPIAELAVAAWFHSPNGWIVDQRGARCDPVAPKDALNRRTEVLKAASKRSGTYVA